MDTISWSGKIGQIDTAEFGTEKVPLYPYDPTQENNWGPMVGKSTAMRIEGSNIIADGLEFKFDSGDHPSVVIGQMLLDNAQIPAGLSYTEGTNVINGIFVYLNGETPEYSDAFIQKVS